MKTRDNQFDNIKGIMIYLVVLGHALSNMCGLRQSPVIDSLYYMIYSFHMPVFIFISGYLSKSGREDSLSDSARKAAAKCLIPFLVFNLFYGLVLGAAKQHLLSGFNILMPNVPLWYLLSLFFWKILAAPISKFRLPLLLTVILGLYIGFVDSVGPFLALSKTFCFFPFFMAGYLMPPDRLSAIRRGKKIIPLMLFLCVLGFACYAAHRGIPYKIFQMKRPYAAYLDSWRDGLLFRSAALLCGFIGIFFFLSTVSQQKTFLSSLGENSITIFLAHMLLIECAAHVFPFRNLTPQGCLLIVVPISALVCLAFGNTFVSRVYQAVMDKITSVLLQQSDASEHAGS